MRRPCTMSKTEHALLPEGANSRYSDERERNEQPVRVQSAFSGIPLGDHLRREVPNAGVPLQVLNTRLVSTADNTGTSTPYSISTSIANVPQYNEFSTIDWAQAPRRPRTGAASSSDVLDSDWDVSQITHDSQTEGASTTGPIAETSYQTRLLHAITGWPYLQTWSAVTAIGLVIGVIAAWLDIAIEWASDLKFGTCSTYPYLSMKKCCWEQWDAGIELLQTCCD